MDVSKLTPAPWWVDDSRVDSDSWQNHGTGEIEAGAMILSGDIEYPMPVVAVTFEPGRFQEEPVDLEFIALARNAFDVMMRRGWSPEKREGMWGVAKKHVMPTRLLHLLWDDPFTALVEADAWYKENVDGKEA